MHFTCIWLNLKIASLRLKIILTLFSNNVFLLLLTKIKHLYTHTHTYIYIYIYSTMASDSIVIPFT